MYEKDGEKYFIVDGHSHFWDASPANWVPGEEEYAKGWIECFHAYQSLGPPETHWSLEHFMKYSTDDYEQDVFVDGHVDHAIFQSTYLRQWYRDGFNTIEKNAELLDRFPGRLTLNGRFDAREGKPGLDQLRADHERYGIQGVKLYTAEWHGDSRGWRLDDPWAYRYFELCRELGIRNIHVHKGPTIRPLDRDAFDVADVDHAATDFTDLNFVVEHCGLPRLEDFCWIATQEPNVHAGLAVAIPFIHTRPRYFAQIMGELLYWVGEDRIQFASDYALWTPRWLIEAFVDFQIPEDLGEYAPITTEQKKKILGLNAAKMYDIPVPAELQLPSADEPAVGPRGADNLVGA